MATLHPLPAPAGKSVPAPDPVAIAEMAAEQALLPLPQPQDEGIVLSAALSRLPVELDVSVPVRDFRVRSLLGLEPGQVIESQWVSGEDLPLKAGAVELAWSEFEVVDTQLAVRLTRLV